jgi:hypothetical protein
MSYSTTASSIVDTLAMVVQAIIETAVDFVTDVVESIGNSIQLGLSALGDKAGSVGGWILKWLGGIFSGITNLLAAALKLIAAVPAGVAGGLIRIIGGAIAATPGLMLKGLVDILSGLVGPLIVAVGHAWSLVQRIFHLQNFERSLTQAECDELNKVFKHSLALYNIRLIEGWSGLFGANARPFTLGNTIYMKSDTSLDTLVHECTHVWQYQHLGVRYTSDALGAQLVYGNDAYKWPEELASRGKTHWIDFNKEAMAQLIEEMYQASCFSSDPPASFGSNAILGDGAVKSLRRRISFRLSQFI